jgi:hypothetical protein
MWALTGHADEGMWMLGNLNKQTRKTMKEMGLQLSPNKLYSSKKASLKDAIVSFGGFCSGVVVSEDGLVFTNHHCGFSCIQQHSSVGHDYLRDGFFARTYEDELPNPELYVRFLLRTENVTKRVLSAVKPLMSEAQRISAIDSVMLVIGGEVSHKDSTLTGVVDPYYAGNEFWLSVYRDFNDVRLVFAPPASIGKFGWDTDNWVWPRHTGDFCVFRIYADRNNRPANYSPDNIPYHPKYVAPITLNGYKEGSFCLTLGYPGSTERYLSSFGIKEMLYNTNQARIDVRSIKQAIWKRGMNRSDSIRIKYASKYDESSNYWKNSIGMNESVRKLHVLEKKVKMEDDIRQWIRQTPSEREKLLHLFTDLELNYEKRSAPNRAQAYFIESFLSAPELMQLALKILNFDFDGERETVTANLKAIVEQYANLDLNIDKDVFTAMLKEYRAKVDTTYLPAFYHTIDQKYKGNERAFVDTLYARSELTTPRGLKRFLEKDSTYHLYDDPAISVGIDLVTKLYDINMQMQVTSSNIEQDERLLNAAIRRMYASRSFYPDANSTMRLSFGSIAGYTPSDGVKYNYYTTTEGILEKAKVHLSDKDFSVQPEILSLLSSGNFGKYADEKGQMKVCFISNNDITGGNSGSAMFNKKGELLGLAFDGNWEAMSSDLLYEPKLQRCVGVDIRYILFIIQKYGKADRLIKELKISASK